MQAFAGTAISEHLAHLADGSLLCRGVQVARTGVQMYRPEELMEWGEMPANLPRGELIPVMRLPEEVFSRKSMASAEGVSLVSPHPGVFLSPSNWKAYSSGHIQNVREGDALPNGDRTLVADLVVRDRELAEQIGLRRRRQVSMGYSCRYEPMQDGTWAQRDIVYNHCAVVEKARGGDALQIMDAEPLELRVQEVLEKFGTVLDRASVRYPEIVDDFMRDMGGIFPQPVLMQDAAESDAESYAQQCRAFHRSTRCR
jgi:hypothetical protein